MRVLLGGECVRKNANEVHDWGNLLLSCDFENALRVVNFNFTEALEAVGGSELPGEEDALLLWLQMLLKNCV